MASDPVAAVTTLIDRTPFKGPRAASSGELAAMVVAEYERTVTTTRLEELLRERGPGGVMPTPSLEEREEAQPCVVCGELIAPGQAYAVKGPCHVGCRP